MNILKNIVLTFIILFFTISTGLFIYWFIVRPIMNDRQVRLNHTGTFKIDMEKTDFGFYNDKRDSYQDLEVTFQEDGKYFLNKQVPFVIDSTGNWIPSESGFDKFGEISYSNTTYKTQTSSGVSSGIGSTFYCVSLHHPISKKNKPDIELLVFSKKGDFHEEY
jgi:hypothetical protein